MTDLSGLQRFCGKLFLSILLGFVAGCGGGRWLMPTPNLYSGSDGKAFDDVPEVFRSNIIDVLYVTDRKSVVARDGSIRYGNGRSPSLAFGSCQVEIGKDVSWETLVRNTGSDKRSKLFRLSMTRITEQARLPETPLPLVKTDQGFVDDPAVVARQAAVVRQFQGELLKRLAKTPTKEAFVFIHGFNNSFETGAFVSAEFWHFIGRRGVPIAYSWPAGAGLNILGYAHDWESGEFTVYHLKQFIRAMAILPELKKIHIIAHSRGTHVVTSAIRELFIEARGAKVDAREVYKIGNLVLASPDLDLEVSLQRLVTERFFRGVERVTLYVASKDRALGVSNWLFGSRRRIGRMSLADLGPEIKLKSAGLPGSDIISARVNLDFTGHDYYRTNPAVSSDLILLLRDNRSPGAANGRPLRQLAPNYWTISDDYPHNTK